MASEIERKFLVVDRSWEEAAVGVRYRQGYIATEGLTVVRVRTMGQRAALTIKGPASGIARDEYEYDIPLADADAMLNDLCKRPLIEKARYKLPVGAHVWEVDVFEGDNAGLIVAEIELAAEDEPFDRPVWLGEEVTGDARYYNANLVDHPYSNWK